MVAFSEQKGFKMPLDVYANLDDWYSNAIKFVHAFDIDEESFEELVEYLKDGHLIWDSENMLQLATNLSYSIRQAMKESIANEHAVSRAQLEVIRKFNTVVNSKDETTRKNALDKLTVLVSDLNDSSIARHFSVELGDQDELETKLKRLTSSMGGLDIDIDADTRKKYKDTDKLKEYNRLKRELNAIPKNFVMNLVRQSGKPYLGVRTVIDEIKAAGIRRHPIPEGFVGYIDDRMKYYTVQGKMLNGTPVGEVQMNPNYNPKKDDGYVCQTKAPMAQGWSNIYTVEHKAAGVAEKFAAVAVFDKKADSIRKRWLDTFKSEGITTRTGVIAGVCELVFQTYGRIGGASNATDGKATYGLTTLQVGHYYKKSNNRELKYPGKKSQEQRHRLLNSNPNQRRLIEMLDALSKDNILEKGKRKPKVRKDRLITFNGRPISANVVNKYLREIGMPPKVTVHKFRTLRGTRLAKSIIDKCPLYERQRKPDAKQVNEWLKKALLKVAKDLGHFANGKLTVATAIANYIDPLILKDYYSKLETRMPVTIEKMVKLAEEGKDV